MMDAKKLAQLKYTIFRILLALLTGSCGTLSFSPYNFWPAAIFSLTGLLVVILNCNYRQSSLFSFFWGVGLFGTGIHWIYNSIHYFGNISKLLTVILMVFLIIYLTLYPIVFSVLLIQIWPTTTFSRLVFAAPALWLLTEHFRGYLFSGFPWLQFGYSQTNSPFRGLAPILGVEGITFILMLMSGLLTFIIIKKCSIWILINTTTFCLFLWALQLIHWYHLEPQRSTKITLIQGNIDQNIKWNINYTSQIINIYLKYSFQNINKSNIIIWPESAIPDTEISQSIFLKTLNMELNTTHTTLITGIIAVEPKVNGYQYYNSIIVIGGTPTYHHINKNRYTKYHLVPFGETIPFKSFLEPYLTFFCFPYSFLKSGEYLQPQLIASKMKFTPSICYEIIFGKRIRNNFRPDTDFLLTISNNAWFGNSIEPWQHLQIAQMRALELGRPLIHSTNNGITAFIKPDGTLQDILPQFIESELTNDIIPTRGLTPYAQLGSYPLQIITVIFLIFAIKCKNSTK